MRALLGVLGARGRSVLGGDVVLAALVVAIVGMMVVPLPTFLLDLLLSLNLAISIVLLLVSLYVTDAARIATFPTILLLTTLFRLALNVSSTRLILLQADAGEVIRAFGQFVVRGNFVVGVVVFLILTLIQFLVIARGAERVAEVAARFALDAMPGKQMAIDADLRSGHLDAAEARRRRSILARESQLYGAMDGAMKFVKGDAVAGLVICVVNIVGGLVVGVTQRGLGTGEALRIYSVLTIGDGLVSQIPALVVSTAAGLIVTRVASEDEGTNLGSEIGAQILAHPRAIAVAAALLLLLATVPGLPGFPFLALGTAAGGLAWSLRRRNATPLAATPAATPTRGDDELISVVVPLALELAPDLAARVGADPEAGGRFVTDALPQIRRAAYLETGILLPAVRVRRVAGLPDGRWRIRLSELPVDGGVIPDGEPDPGALVEQALLRVVRRHAGELVGIQETQALLDTLERTHPALVAEVVPKLVPLPLAAEVLRRLVEEGISIRDLRAILGALAEWGRAEKDPVLLTEYVRTSLRRQITQAHARNGRLAVYLLDPLVEDTVRSAIVKTQSGSYLALEPDLSRDILAAVRTALSARAKDTAPAVLLTSMEVRRFVRRLVELEHPDVAVLSFQELLPDVAVQPVARIGVA